MPILRLSPKPTIVTGHTKAANKNQGRSLRQLVSAPEFCMGSVLGWFSTGYSVCMVWPDAWLGLHRNMFSRERIDHRSAIIFFPTLVTINDHAREKNYGCTRSSYSEANKSEVDYFSDVSNASLLFVIIPLIDITS